MNDIALVKLNQPVDLADKIIGSICLPMTALRYPKLFSLDRADTVIIPLIVVNSLSKSYLLADYYRAGTQQ